jgi:DNA-binding response OmpR family regulator
MLEQKVADTILIVEDEEALRETLSYNLEQQGYKVETACEGRAALKIARELQPNLIIMDIMIPGIDGMEVTRILRAEMTVPILMLTARSEEIDRVLGLEMGADDYMTKPFSMRELLARVKAMLRRVRIDKEEVEDSERPAAEILKFGNLEVDIPRHETRLDGNVIALKPKEFDLLLFLARHRGQVLSRELILERVWGWDFIGGTRTVDVHVRWLRSKIEIDPADPKRILTVRGAGYRFEG